MVGSQCGFGGDVWSTVEVVDWSLVEMFPNKVRECDHLGGWSSKVAPQLAGEDVERSRKVLALRIQPTHEGH